MTSHITFLICCCICLSQPVFCILLSPHLKRLRDSSQERVALLEARLTEEKDWRKQLEVDLGAAQAALKKDKEVKNTPMHADTVGLTLVSL